MKILALQELLQQHLGWHAARTKFAAAFLLALLKVKSVGFPRLALALNPRAKNASNELSEDTVAWRLADTHFPALS